MAERKRKLLFARDVAEEAGISRVAASRFLARLEAEHGPTVVGRAPSPGRFGFARYTTRQALRRISPLGSGDLEARLSALEARVSALEE